MRNLAYFVFLLLFPVILTAQTTADKPLRTVKGRTVISKELPPVNLQFGKDFNMPAVINLSFTASPAPNSTFSSMRERTGW
jgi:hypothetical protein